MLVDIMPLKILVSAGAPVALGEWSPANRMPELVRTILGIGAGRGGSTNRMSGVLSIVKYFQKAC
jgi:hypothetical protein